MGRGLQPRHTCWLVCRQVLTLVATTAARLALLSVRFGVFTLGSARGFVSRGAGQGSVGFAARGVCCGGGRTLVSGRETCGVSPSGILKRVATRPPAPARSPARLGCADNAHDSGVLIPAPEFRESHGRDWSSHRHLLPPLGDGDCARVRFIAQMLNSVDRGLLCCRAPRIAEDGVPVRFAKGRTPLRFVQAREPAASRTRDRCECFTFGHEESVMNALGTPVFRSAVCAHHNLLMNPSSENLQGALMKSARGTPQVSPST